MKGSKFAKQIRRDKKFALNEREQFEEKTINDEKKRIEAVAIRSQKDTETQMELK